MRPLLRHSTSSAHHFCTLLSTKGGGETGDVNCSSKISSYIASRVGAGVGVGPLVGFSASLWVAESSGFSVGCEADAASVGVSVASGASVACGTAVRAAAGDSSGSSEESQATANRQIRIMREQRTSIWGTRRLLIRHLPLVNRGGLNLECPRYSARAVMGSMVYNPKQ